ncbi:uncharacterized protein LOC122531301 [Frieseomelitta varia]|uniref:uncharacterized protein LOC122531301 n=1 Tax=Frieseomelitta varia TaxID=561572 RepID=UPI001CB6AB94|nr:uncharacterized protein LOC122531301 [Frieseomelitta varia]
MAILCAITVLLELVLLVALTGVLASVAAVLRLMEVTITIIHPFTIFMLQQSGKIIIFGVRETKRLASDAYYKIHVDRGPVTAVKLLTINMRQPETPYYRSAIPGMVEETFPRERDFPLVPASREEELEEKEEESVVHSPGADQIEETNDGKVVRDESRKSIEEDTSEATTINGVQ